MPSHLTAFLSGSGRDGAGRSLDAVLAFTDEELEYHHDFIQWLFPLPEPSRAVPGSPVLTASDRDEIAASEAMTTALRRAAEKMERYYETNDHWLRPQDHNHLRITRIIRSLKILVGPDDAEAFYAAVMLRVGGAGGPVNSTSIRFWQEALG